MSLVMNGYTFPVLHQLPLPRQALNNTITANFIGVPGAVEISDINHERDIEIECRFSGYATATLLETAQATVESKVATFRDKTLTVTNAAGHTTTFRHCSFLGFTPAAPEFVDGSGVNGWCQDGVLRFIQLRRTA